jgi:ubiquinone/menaquinone biosynthesis C-methylase UbiE
MNLEKERKYYNQLAKNYDDYTNIRWSCKKRRRLEIVKEYIRVEPNMKILDIGCGTGYYTFPFAEDGVTVIGLDLSENMLEIANNKDRKNQVRFIRGNMYSLPFKDNCFDIVISMGTVGNSHRALKEIQRIVKHKRHQIIVDVKNALSLNYCVTYGYRYFTSLFKINWPWKINKQFTQYGFKIEKSKCCNFIPPGIPFVLIPFFDRYWEKIVERIPFLRMTGQYIILKLKSVTHTHQTHCRIGTNK